MIINIFALYKMQQILKFHKTNMQIEDTDLQLSSCMLFY